MVRYEVRVQLKEDLLPAFERYMRETHLPEILATVCFSSIRFERSEDGAFRSCYEAADQGSVDRYLGQYAPRFREDFMARFPEGCDIRREVWTQIQSFI